MSQNYLMLHNKEELATVGITGCRANLALCILSRVYDLTMLLFIVGYALIIVIDLWHT